MKKIIVEEFGHPDVLQIKEIETPKPGPGQVLVALKSVGMNHADLMARKGEYLIASGNPPFTPGIEGGGVIEAVGDGVKDRKVGQRIILGADVPGRAHNVDNGDHFEGGTYTTHYIVNANKTVPAPDKLDDHNLGALWLPYLTAWGCLVWKQNIKPGQFVAISAASSSVGLAAAQIAKRQGAIPIGLTTSEAKAEKIKTLPENAFDHIIVTHKPDRTMKSFRRDLFKIAGRRGIDVFFDPVAAGDYLQMEILSLAQHGTIWIYGLLGTPSKLDVTPLIRKMAGIRGWYLSELTEEGGDALWEGYKYILEGFEQGGFKQVVAKTFKLEDVVKAHQEFQTGNHIGKFILLPN